MKWGMLDVPKDLVGAQSYSCANCHEAFLVKPSTATEPASILRFTVWQAKHGPACTRPPLAVITPDDLVILALLNAPSH